MYSKGFTLVELMIVVAIIGILASIAIPSYQRYMLKAKVTGVVTTAKGYMSLVEENISENSTCFGRNSDGTRGNQYQITTPDFINNPATASTNLVWRGDTFVPSINGNGCMVVVRGNPNVFNANFQLWYLSTSITDLSSSSGAVIYWACYFELFDTAANNARMLPVMPSNCTNRAGNF